MLDLELSAHVYLSTSPHQSRMSVLWVAFQKGKPRHRMINPCARAPQRPDTDSSSLSVLKGPRGQAGEQGPWDFHELRTQRFQYN